MTAAPDCDLCEDPNPRRHLRAPLCGACRSRRTIVLVTGGRDFEGSHLAGIWLRAQIRELAPAAVLHGAARGADLWGAAIVRELAPSIWIEGHPAAWSQGAAAGPRRNAAMLRRAQGLGARVVVLAFPGGRGTDDMIHRAERAGCEVRRAFERD